MFPCVLSFNTAALSSRVERVRKSFRSHRQDDKKSNRNSYHIVADLGFAVDDSLLSAYQTVQTRHGGACGRWRSAVNNSRAAQTNKHTGMVVLMVDSCARPSSSLFFPPHNCRLSLLCARVTTKPFLPFSTVWALWSQHDTDLTFSTKALSKWCFCMQLRFLREHGLTH